MKRILFFIKKETVLVVAILLAVISMIFIPPDQQYPKYIDFRTLGILFGLMTCVAGVQQLGVFDRLAGMLLRKVSGRMAITSVLVMLCFFSSFPVSYYILFCPSCRFLCMQIFFFQGNHFFHCRFSRCTDRISHLYTGLHADRIVNILFKYR